ncbi:MAG: LacI family DNA-binding transcriptional regulator [Actinomycetota bacterium]
MERKRVTIVDVAHEAGVSHSTVSRVLSDHPQISEDTRRKVHEAIDSLGYVADLRGRALAGGRTGIVGLVVPDLRSKAILGIVRAIDAAVAAAGQNLMVCTTRGRDEDEAGYVIQLSMGAVDGLIAILAGDTAPMTEDLDSRDFPYVLLDYDDAEFAGVRRALEVTAENAVRLLLERIDEPSS